MAHRRPELAAAAPPLEDVVRAWAPDLGRHLDTLGLEDAAAAYAAALPETGRPAGARGRRRGPGHAPELRRGARRRPRGGAGRAAPRGALRDDARDAAGDFRGAVESLERAHAIFEARREPFEVAGTLGDLARARGRAARESEMPNFKGSDLGQFPLVSADFGRAIISRNGLDAWMFFSRLDDSKLELEEPESPGVRDFEVEAPEAPQSRPDSPMDEDDLL
ncbi:hypothetical protein JL722_9045 [Aureococcus anophagefferens]|nr:hypothetical protein JL722_9045 [Aureococcus anophagefferens]